jgi:hypothetical protein
MKETGVCAALTEASKMTHNAGTERRLRVQEGLTVRAMLTSFSRGKPGNQLFVLSGPIEHGPAVGPNLTPLYTSRCIGDDKSQGNRSPQFQYPSQFR